MAILDALGLKAVGLKRSLVVPSIFTWLFTKNRSERRPISYMSFFFACGALTYAHTQQLYIATVIESFVLDTVAPIVSAIQKPIHIIRDISTNFTTHKELQTEILRLTQQNANLLMTNTALRQYAFIKKDAALKMPLVTSLPETQILHHKYHIATTLNQPSLGQHLFINISKDMGIEKNDIALGSKGIIGRVTKVGARSAQIATLLDPTFRIPVEVMGIQAIAAGTGSETMELTHIKDAQHSINVGDIVLTSGFGGIYPKALPVGIIASVDNKLIRIQPFEQGSKDHSVILVKATPVTEDRFPSHAQADDTVD